MIDYKEFEEKIRTMTAHDIIMAMVEGLRKPRTEIDMRTYGEIKGGICYGCAATNAILHIMEAGDEEAVDHVRGRESEGYRTSALWRFECAINDLRCGLLGSCNANATRLGLARITPIPGQILPVLRNDYTEEQLQEYEQLAEYQLTVKN